MAFVTSFLYFVAFIVNIGVLSFEKTECEPIPSTLEPKYHKNIIGIEAPLWTEWIPNQRRIDWQTFPRLIAVAESAWSQFKSKDYQSFKKRLDLHLHRLDLLGVNYAKRKEFDPGLFRRFLLPLKFFRDPNS